jgi:hypothetical protein
MQAFNGDGLGLECLLELALLTFGKTPCMQERHDLYKVPIQGCSGCFVEGRVA